MVCIEELGISCLEHSNLYALWVEQKTLRLLKFLGNKLGNAIRSLLLVAEDNNAAGGILNGRDDEPMRPLMARQELEEEGDLGMDDETVLHASQHQPSFD